MIINKRKVIIVIEDVEVGLNEIAPFGLILRAFEKVTLFRIKCISCDKVLDV